MVETYIHDVVGVELTKEIVKGDIRNTLWFKVHITEKDGGEHVFKMALAGGEEIHPEMPDKYK